MVGEVGVDVEGSQELQDSIPKKLHPLVATPAHDNITMVTKQYTSPVVGWYSNRGVKPQVRKQTPVLDTYALMAKHLTKTESPRFKLLQR